MWAFRICEKLNIDDPVLWMDNIDPRVLDRWIAYMVVKNDKRQGKGEMKTIDEAAKTLRLRHG